LNYSKIRRPMIPQIILRKIYALVDFSSHVM
jgi:hypothetical protein